MKIKSAKSFRYWYKTKIKEIDRYNKTYNENFVGTYHRKKEGKTIKGFFEMYHGDKPDIASYLPSILKIAEDGQAIYEFLQNAVDCGSTHFYIFYNEQYFLAINNGSPFDIEGLQSILNIAQTTKKDPDKIGRFGIGFKLAHRLVGKNEGTDELVKQYKGPILFSWSKLADLESLLKNEQIEPIAPPQKGSSNGFYEAPYLLKLLLTNFPSDPNETVKDINYKDRILFSQGELNELVAFLNENFENHSDNLKKNVLKQGSLFFIKLGEDKKKLLDKDYSELVNGIQYSMNTLKRLQKVYINNDEIGKISLQLEEGTIKRGSNEFIRISPEYKEFDIKFAIGFNTIQFGSDKSYAQIKLLKEKPNFYKYFPMGDEINGFGFIVHCDSFSNEANRRKLHEDDINRNLFPELAKYIIQRIGDFKNTDRNKFLNLYASLLLSDIPERQNNKWLKPIFYDNLLNSLHNNIPTKTGYTDNAQNVKINKLRTPLNLVDFGLGHIQWFEWDNEVDALLIDEAKKTEKLGIEEWDIRDILEKSNLESINNWVASCDEELYESFLKELEESSLRQKTKERIRQIKLFKFFNGRKYIFFSFNEVISIQDSVGNTTFSYSNVFVNNEKIKGIIDELYLLGIGASEKSVLEYPNIFSSVELPDDNIYYTKIAEKCISNTLSAEEKRKLFLNFINEETKFNGIDDDKLKKLHLFCDNQGNIKPLSELVSSSLNTPVWLNSYKIKSEEYFKELNSYLIQEHGLFDKILLPNIDIIKDDLTEAKEIKELVAFFKDNHRTFFNEYIIQKQPNRFAIIDKSDKFQVVPSNNKETKSFIEAHLSNHLIVLPYDFSDFNNEDGIVKGENLHSRILELVDVDTYKEQLVDVIHYDEPKRKFLLQLSEVRLISGKQYSEEDFEYKVLEWACSPNILTNENDIQNFRNSIVIEAKGENIRLSIAHSKDEIEIGNHKLSLAKILPDTYQNIDHLSNLINQFVRGGIDKDLIEKLFGIKQKVEPSEIFDLLLEQTTVVKNAEQLTFLLLYGQVFEESIANFKVETLDEKEGELSHDYYLKPYSFVGDNYLLKSQYSDISEIFDSPISIGKGGHQILLKPYFAEDKFICPNIKSTLSNEEKIDFLNFLFTEWQKDKTHFSKEIDWSNINDTDTIALLGFNPEHSAFPNQYAYEKEQLPEYVINWINTDNSKISFVSDLGIWTEKSVIVDLRKFLIWEIDDFQNNRIEREERFDDNETMLFNTLEWLKENETELKTTEQFETLIKIVEVINENRTNSGALVIKKEYDFELLKEQAEEWKVIDTYAIYLYDGKMPIIVKLDEINDYIFYRYPDKDYAVDGNIVYINKKEDRTRLLQRVALDGDNDFSTENSKDAEIIEKDEEIEKLKSEIERLRGESSNNPPRNTERTKSFLDEVNEFIADLEETEWNNYVPELKNLIEDFGNHPKQKQKIFNLIAKIKLTKEKNIWFEDSDEGFNVVKIKDEKFFVHSARGAFAYIHPVEILKMKDEGYKMALDFSTKSGIKIYDTAEEILQLNTNHILAYQYKKTMGELFTFCEANRDANKHLLIIDKNNSGEKSRALLKLLNIEDDYQ